MNYPNLIKAGYWPVVDCHTSHIAVKFSKLESKIDRRTGKSVEEEPKKIKNGESVIAFMEPQKPLVCETYSTYPPLGRFAIRDMKMTVAEGVIREINKKNQDQLKLLKLPKKPWKKKAKRKKENK